MICRMKNSNTMWCIYSLKALFKITAGKITAHQYYFIHAEFVFVLILNVLYPFRLRMVSMGIVTNRRCGIQPCMYNSRCETDLANVNLCDVLTRFRPHTMRDALLLFVCLAKYGQSVNR